MSCPLVCDSVTGQVKGEEFGVLFEGVAQSLAEGLCTLVRYAVMAQRQILDPERKGEQK